jgi:hypothetical protein
MKTNRLRTTALTSRGRLNAQSRDGSATFARIMERVRASTSGKGGGYIFHARVTDAGCESRGWTFTHYAGRVGVESEGGVSE